MEALRRQQTLFYAASYVAFCYKGILALALSVRSIFLSGLCLLAVFQSADAASSSSARDIISAFPQLQLNGVATYDSDNTSGNQSPNSHLADFWVALYLPTSATQRAGLFPAPGEKSLRKKGQRALQFRFNKTWDKSKFRQWASERVAKYHPPEQLVFWIQPFLQLLLSIDRDFSPSDTLTFVQIPHQQTQLFFNREWLFSSESPSHFDIMLTGILGTESQPSSMAKLLLSGGGTIPKQFRTPTPSPSSDRLVALLPSNKTIGTNKKINNQRLPKPNIASSQARISRLATSQATLHQDTPKAHLNDAHSEKSKNMGAGPRPMLMMKYLKTLPKQAMSFTPNTRAYVTRKSEG